MAFTKPVVACIVGRWKAKLTRAVGHAVRAMYLYSAMADLAGEFDDAGLMAANASGDIASNWSTLIDLFSDGAVTLILCGLRAVLEEGEAVLLRVRREQRDRPVQRRPDAEVGRRRDRNGHVLSRVERTGNGVLESTVGANAQIRITLVLRASFRIRMSNGRPVNPFSSWLNSV